MYAGSCHKDVCAIFDLLLEVTFFYSQLINMYTGYTCVKDSSAEGTCTFLERPVHCLESRLKTFRVLCKRTLFYMKM